MGLRSKNQLRLCLPLALALAAFPSRLPAQDTVPGSLGAPGVHPAGGAVQAGATNIYVSVREATGFPLSQTADVKLTCPLTGVKLSGPTKNTSLAEFLNIPPGDCTVNVTSLGFRPSSERATIADSYSARDQYIYVYLHSESEPPSAVIRPVPLSVMKEIDKSLDSINKNRMDDARKHLSKASAIAPQNADVLYLLGMVDYRQNQLDAAQKNFAAAISIYPAHERALAALGEAQIKAGQYAAAQLTLQKAIAINRAAWRTRLLLANAFAAQREFASAEEQARMAVSLAGDDAPIARAFLAQVQAAETVPLTDAANSLSLAPVASGTPGTRRAPADESPSLGNALVANSATLASASPAPALHISDAILAPISPGAMHAWAPADIDSSAPSVAADVPCSADDVVARASHASIEQLENFEKFMASEHIEHQEVDAYGRPERIKTRDFSYLAFIDRDKYGQVFLNEERDGGRNTEGFPTSLATVGLLSLGVDIFHPGFSRFLLFKCEGLGQWQGHPAWLMHFTQRPGQKSFLRLWQTRTATVEIPLKGRVWLAASTYQVLHIESDLREPVDSLELARDHLVIDYGPVNFEHGQSQLWLPWYADMYLELHGHRYHHRHTLSNYALFTVETTNQVNAPKEKKVETQSPQ
jgi:tetratricopeptide (TPR) repeat protein